MVVEIKPALGYSQIERKELLKQSEKEKILKNAKIEQITELAKLFLTDNELEIFERIHSIRIYHSAISHFPEGNADFISLRFNTTQQELKDNQKIIRIENKITGESTLFNSIRAKRPGQNTQKKPEYIDGLTPDKCDFCHLTTNTPIDLIGKRIFNKYSATAANAASYDQLSCLVIPTAEYHNPQQLNKQVFSDMLLTAKEWLDEVSNKNRISQYPVITWNYGRRAGQSIFPHPHLSVLSAIGKPYSQVEKLRQNLADYLYFNSTPFFDDLAKSLEPLELVFPPKKQDEKSSNSKIILHLTPKREKEALIISDRFDNNFIDSIYQTIDWYKSLNVTNFNLAIFLKPLNSKETGWEGFPFLARITDRGDANTKNSDMGAMECYVTPVVSSDPLVMANSFKQHLKSKNL